MSFENDNIHAKSIESNSLTTSLSLQAIELFSNPKNFGITSEATSVSSIPKATITDSAIIFGEPSTDVAFNTNSQKSNYPIERSGSGTTRNGGSYEASATAKYNPISGVYSAEAQGEYTSPKGAEATGSVHVQGVQGGAYSGEAQGQYTSKTGQEYGGVVQVQGSQGEGGTLQIQTQNHGQYSKTYPSHQ